jgi:hypothetical protein
VFLLEIGKYVESTNKVSLTRESKVRRYHRHFRCNIYTTKFNSPMKNANDRLVVVGICWVKFRQDVKLWAV